MDTAALADQVADKVRAGARLDREEGRWLLTEAPLLELGALASEARFARLPDRVVTFVIDSNPNYTNVCVTDCQFCAFYRKPGDPEAWTLTVDEVLQKVEAAAIRGATTVLLQGGHNPALPLDYYLTLVRETRRRFPQVTPHFFTASEIQTIAGVSGLTIGEVLDCLYEAGQRTLPGGGAEVLSARVRTRIAPKKGGPAALGGRAPAAKSSMAAKKRPSAKAGRAASRAATNSARLMEPTVALFVGSPICGGADAYAARPPLRQGLGPGHARRRGRPVRPRPGLSRATPCGSLPGSAPSCAACSTGPPCCGTWSARSGRRSTWCCRTGSRRPWTDSGRCTASGA